jgi:hypothetical protein
MAAIKSLSDSKNLELKRLALRLRESQITICGWPNIREEHGEPGNNPRAQSFIKIGVGEG